MIVLSIMSALWWVNKFTQCYIDELHCIAHLPRLKFARFTCHADMFVLKNMSTFQNHATFRAVFIIGGADFSEHFSEQTKNATLKGDFFRALNLTGKCAIQNGFKLHQNCFKLLQNCFKLHLNCFKLHQNGFKLFKIMFKYFILSCILLWHLPIHESILL